MLFPSDPDVPDSSEPWARVLSQGLRVQETLQPTLQWFQTRFSIKRLWIAVAELAYKGEQSHVHQRGPGAQQPRLLLQALVPLQQDGERLLAMFGAIGGWMLVTLEE